VAITTIATTKARFFGAAGPVSTPAIDTTGATLIEITIAYDNTASSLIITDNRGNTYTGLTASTIGTWSVRKFYCLLPVVGAGHIVTVNASSAYAAFVVRAYGGATLVLSSQAGNTVTSGTSLSTGSVTPPNAPALVTSGIAWAGTAGVPTATAPMTLVDGSAGVASQAYGVAASDEVQATATARNPGWTWTGSENRAGCTACYAIVVLPAPIAYWPFDEATGTTAADASGNGHTATLNHATWDTTALKKFGAAGLANTDTAYGASFASISLGTTYSIAFWVNGWNGSNDGLSLGGPSENYATYFDSSTQIYHSSGASNFVNAPHGGLTGSHHIVVTRTGLTVTFYKDGVLLATRTLPSNTALSLSTISGYSNNTFALVATLDEVRLYDVALSAPQVAALFAVVPVTRVNVKSNATWTSATGTTFASGTQTHTAGNTLIVCVGASTNSATVLGVTDTAGNTYTKVDHVGSALADTYREEIWYAKNITGHAANDVTVTWSAAVPFRGIIVLQYAGLSTIAPFDATAKGTNSAGSGATSVTTGTLTTAAPNELHLLLGRWGTTPTYPAGFTEASGDANVHVGEAFVAAPMSGTYTITATSFCTLALAAAFTPTVAGPAALRVTQDIAELLSLPTPALRLTQDVIEVLGTTILISSPLRLTQDVVELLQQSVPPPPALRVSQALVELLSLTPAHPARLTQLVVDLLTQQPHATALTQLSVEAFTTTTHPARLTELALELRTQHSAALRMTQVLVEIFLVPGPCQPTGSLPIDHPPAGGSCAAGLLP